MRRGPWHQLGDRSQKLVREQLQAGNGVGVIMSPRDLKLNNAALYSEAYRGLGASVLCDQQFYVPEFSNRHLVTYPTSQHRRSISNLMQIDAAELVALRDNLRTVSETLAVDAVLAPAVLYQAGRKDLWNLNERLLRTAREVGTALGKPTYATIVLDRSVTSSVQTLEPTLAHVTGLPADGWYFGFEFEAERIPSDRDATKRCCAAILALASTGRPVLHAFAGPMAPLSIGAGATGAAIGHSQNLWRFTPERWQEPTGGGGGGAPSRFFSRALWGTIIYPDELAQLEPGLRNRVVTPTAFSAAVSANPPQIWPRWEANRHLLSMLGSEVSRLSAMANARTSANAVIDLLANAVALHGEIGRTGLVLGDRTNVYQENWRTAMHDTVTGLAQNYEYLELLP